MAIGTTSSGRLRALGREITSKEELHKLAQIAAQLGPGKGTRKFKPEDHMIPREAKIAFGIGAAGLVLCLAFLAIRGIANRKTDQPSEAVPAIKTQSAPSPEGN